MLNDLEKVLNVVEQLILDDNFSYWKIAKNTGLGTQTVYNIKKDVSKLQNTRIGTLKALYEYAIKEGFEVRGV